jgi:hypothetical protein
MALRRRDHRPHLGICGKAGTTDLDVLRELQAKVSGISDSLALKFGVPKDRLVNLTGASGLA